MPGLVLADTPLQKHKNPQANTDDWRQQANADQRGDGQHSMGTGGQFLTKAGQDFGEARNHNCNE